MKLEVLYVIDGTVLKEEFECDKKPSMQIFADGRGKVITEDAIVIYRDIQRIKYNKGSQQ